MYLKSLFITVVVCSATMVNAQTCDITEAGFGADLGAEKFYNIKCRMNH